LQLPLLEAFPADFVDYQCKWDFIDDYHVQISIILGCFFREFFGYIVSFKPGVRLHPHKVYSPVLHG